MDHFTQYPLWHESEVPPLPPAKRSKSYKATLTSYAYFKDNYLSHIPEEYFLDFDHHQYLMEAYLDWRDGLPFAPCYIANGPREEEAPEVEELPVVTVIDEILPLVEEEPPSTPEDAQTEIMESVETHELVEILKIPSLCDVKDTRFEKPCLPKNEESNSQVTTADVTFAEWLNDSAQESQDRLTEPLFDPGGQK